MTPDFKIFANGNDITEIIKKHLVRITLNDNFGLVNDSLQIELNNHNGHIKTPTSGVDLSIAIGYGDDLINKGSFEVDGVSASGPPDILTINAVGSRINLSLRMRQTITHKKISIKSIVESAATRHNMVAKVSEVFAKVIIKYKWQESQSDLDFITRLAVENDAEFKPISGVLLFYKKDDFKKTTGEKLKPITINRSDCEQYLFTASDRAKYNSVIARYYERWQAEAVSVRIGEQAPSFTIRGTCSTKAKALARAEAKYNELLRGQSTGELTLIGNANIAAEHQIITKGFYPQYNTNWKCTFATHTLDEKGYKTTLKLTGLIAQ